MPRQFYCVYVLLDPVTRHVRYIGETKNAKGRKTAYMQYGGTTANSPLAGWFTELKAAGKKPIFQIVCKLYGGYGKIASRLLEQYLIKSYSRRSDGHLILNFAGNPRFPRYWQRGKNRRNNRPRRTIAGMLF